MIVFKQGVVGVMVFDEMGMVVGVGFCVDVVDIVGVGDVFVVGYFSVMFEYFFVEEMLCCVNVCGVVVCFVFGDWEVVLILCELECFFDGDVDFVQC